MTSFPRPGFRKSTAFGTIAMVLLALLLLLACGEEEKVDITGLTIMEPSGNEIKKLPPGSTAFIKVRVEKTPPDLPITYRWEFQEGQMKVTSEKDSAALYTAPSSEGIKLITLVALLGEKELSRETFPIEVVARDSRIRVSQAPEQDVRAEVPSTIAQTGSQQVRTSSRESVPSSSATPLSITNPQNGKAVSHIISVQGKVRELREGESLIISVRPIPEDPHQLWWVQTLPLIEDDGTWYSRPVYIGLPDDPSGLPFRICAVITKTKLRRGDQLRRKPDGTSSCIDIRRK